ncbi:hypothetical protein PCANC_09540 [Puccinia coronata f. sp. avenae]|uniref:Uncharacterized protein n=1 Tax=Puccinia coronata f. sp. avenae TaxID=200324 RepID=A0A2N5V581_9BASI|nr:hypothetical protein PCANC_09540 [Puccinia coronata f. sp. avenae]
MSDNVPPHDQRKPRDVMATIHRLTPKTHAKCKQLGLAQSQTASGNNPFQWSGGRSINKQSDTIPGLGQPSKANMVKGKQTSRDNLIPISTTFIPKITALSADNWRCTEHHNHQHRMKPPAYWTWLSSTM